MVPPLDNSSPRDLSFADGYCLRVNSNGFGASRFPRGNQIAKGVRSFSILLQLEMQMRTCAPAGISQNANQLLRFDLLPDHNQILGTLGIKGRYPFSCSLIIGFSR